LAAKAMIARPNTPTSRAERALMVTRILSQLQTEVHLS
jgi:hypothetical protein